MSQSQSSNPNVEKIIRDMLVGSTISRREYFTILALAEDIMSALKRAEACKDAEVAYHSIDPYGWLAMDVECDGKVYRVEVPMILRISEYEKSDIRIGTRVEL
jgi:hypothetical protein